MKLPITAVLAVVFIAISCHKPKETPDPLPPAPVTYMSMTAGDSRTYETTDNTATPTPLTTINTSVSSTRDTSILGKTYHVFTNSNGSANEYYNKTGSDYYTFRAISAALATPPIEVIYLKDAAASTSWSQTVNVPLSGVPTTVPVVFTNIVAAKGLTRTVNGKTYTDVVQVTTTAVVTGLPAGSVITDIQSYYAPKFGLIENKNKISLPLLTTNIDQNTILKLSNIQ
jgi:hypothetical protein